MTLLKVSCTLGLLAAVLLAFACSSPSVNTNTNVNTQIKLDPANMPPGLSGNSFTPDVNTPGIPANANPLPRDKTTNVPGIPNNANAQNRKGNANSTPGIPDSETLKRQMENPRTDVNGSAVSAPKGKQKGQ